MKIDYVKAENFLCYGETPLFIDFRKLGNIVCVKGINYDQGEKSSNGAGKTTLYEAVVYGLFGQLMKNLGHKEAINIKNKKNLRVEIQFELNGNTYRIIRKRKPDELSLFVNEKDESKGGIPATQDEINKIIKLNFNSFINVSCFGQHNVKPFLTCSAAEKRQIVENLLSLEKYNMYSDVAKKKKAFYQDKLKVDNILYEKFNQNIDTIKLQIQKLKNQKSEWLKNKQQKIQDINEQIVYQTSLMNNENNEQEILTNLSILEGELVVEKTKKIKNIDLIGEADKKLSGIKEKRQTIFLETKELIFEINKNKKFIDDKVMQNTSLKTKEGTTCPVCYSKVQKENFKHVLEHNNDEMTKTKEHNSLCEEKLKEKQEKLALYETTIQKMNDALSKGKTNNLLIDGKIRILEDSISSTKLKINKTSINSHLLNKIETLKDQVSQLSQEEDPFVDIVSSLEGNEEDEKKKLAAVRESVKESSDLVPYYDFWVKGFGDQGIRSLVIDDIIPSLNARINYWLQFLIDNKIKVCFDNKFDEEITSPSTKDVFVYNGMSGGEHKRVDLAISQGFADVMMFLSQSCPSLLVLDEICTNLDRNGVQAVYSMICELSKTRQILITTHDIELLEMLGNHDQILVEKKNGFSYVKN